MTSFNIGWPPFKAIPPPPKASPSGIKLFDTIFGDDLDKNVSDDEIMNKTINRWKQEAEKEQEAENS